MITKLAKLNASVPANEALDRMLSKVNDGFSGGKVTKTQLTSWIALEFEKSLFEKAVPKIREAHFDKVSYLESVIADLKRSKREGSWVLDLEERLTPIYSRRKPKTTNT